MADWMLLDAAFILYGFSNFCFLLYLGTRRKNLSRWGVALAACGAGLHLARLMPHGLSLKPFPVLDASQALGFLAVLILGVYFLLEWRWKLAGLGFPATALAFLFTLISIFYAPYRDSQAALSSVGTVLEVHVAAILLGFGILALAFCSSAAYLAQDSMLRGKRLANFSKRLPPLETLDSLTNKLAVFGFVSLSIGILFGGIWAARQWGQGWSWDPKIVAALLTWMIYAVYIGARTFAGWKGRRSVMLIILGFIFILVTFLGTNFFPGRHRFLGDRGTHPENHSKHDVSRVKDVSPLLSGPSSPQKLGPQRGPFRKTGVDIERKLIGRVPN